jgi:hypothetical protein
MHFVCRSRRLLIKPHLGHCLEAPSTVRASSTFLVGFTTVVGVAGLPALCSESRSFRSDFITADSLNLLFLIGIVNGNAELRVDMRLGSTIFRRLAGSVCVLDSRMRLICSKAHFSTNSLTLTIEYFSNAAALPMPMIRSIQFWRSCISCLVPSVQASSRTEL